MNQQNIDFIIARLLALGCEATIETRLRCQLCFSPLQFDLSSTRNYGDDVCQFTMRVEKNDHGSYLLKYYTAVLRKKIEVPRELQELDKRMAKIDWVAIAKGRQVDSVIPPAIIQSAFEVLEEMRVSGMAADLLRYKYWQGTEMEPLILQVALQKSAWEISERFYFFDDLEVISFSEAVRFLNSRWMEKQLTARKKLLEKNTDDRKDSSGKELLLKKKPRRSVVKAIAKN